MRGKGRRWKELARTRSKSIRRVTLKPVRRKRKIRARPRRPAGALNVGRLIPFSRWLVYQRDKIIIPDFVGKMVSVYNGHRWFTSLIRLEMVGARFGEFSPPKQWRGSMIHRGNKTEVKKK